MDWLNQNAGAVQAVATVVLILITWRYVRLTAKTAKAAQAQTDAIHARIDAERAELIALATSIKDQIESLPPQQGMELGEGFIVRDQNLDRLRALASSVGPAAAVTASEIQKHVEWLRPRFEGLKEGRYGRAWAWDKWRANRADAIETVDYLLEQIEGRFEE